MKRKLKPPPAHVRREWMKHWPTRPYSFWVEVAKLMRAHRRRGHDVAALRTYCQLIDGRRTR